jgi:hypothetical protein
MAHRPLSEWITMVPLSPDGTALWDPASDTNFGDERADARDLQELAIGWQRLAVPVSLGYHALALARATSPSAAVAVAVELDDFARPLRVTAHGARVIASLEDHWPAAPVSRADYAVLAGEDVAVRYVLLARLAAEGQPPPGLFHLLPWDLVDLLTDQIALALGGTPPPEEITVLGHWLAPAGSRFTASLEQLDEGLRRQDAGLARVAATTLCSRLLHADVARLPGTTRQRLARLLGLLREQNRFLGFTAAAAARLLAEGEEGDAQAAKAVRVDSPLAPAAHSGLGVRRESGTVDREPFELQLAVTATGRAEIILRASVNPGDDQRIAGSYGLLLQPVVLTAARGTTRYLVPLRISDDEISGRLSLPVPRGHFVAADLDGPPIGAAEAMYLTAEEIERSISGLRTRSALELWAGLSGMLPTGHPLRAVIDREANDH